MNIVSDFFTSFCSAIKYYLFSQKFNQIFEKDLGNNGKLVLAA